MLVPIHTSPTLPSISIHSVSIPTGSPTGVQVPPYCATARPELARHCQNRARERGEKQCQPAASVWSCTHTPYAPHTDTNPSSIIGRAGTRVGADATGGVQARASPLIRACQSDRLPCRAWPFQFTSGASSPSPPPPPSSLLQSYSLLLVQLEPCPSLHGCIPE